MENQKNPPTIENQRKYFEIVELAEEKGWWLEMVDVAGGKYQLRAISAEGNGGTASMLFWTLKEVEEALGI